MTTAASPLTEIAAQWRQARRLYAVYSALLERYALGLPPCRDLESPVDRAQPEVIARIWQWFAQMDERVHVHQLRQLMQTTPLGTEENLRALLQHHLAKKAKGETDRDKIDFLLVQYLSSAAPAGFYERDVTFEEVAQLLHPVLGEVEEKSPEWLKPLKKATQSLEPLTGLRDLLENGTLDQMRKLKAGAGAKYFSPTALVAITRFNFMVRRTFVRLIAADLAAVRSALQEMEARGVKYVDCTRAGLSAVAPLENLKQICQEWKKPFRAAYAAGQNFRELVEIRAALEDAVAQPAPSSDYRSLAPLGMTNSGAPAPQAKPLGMTNSGAEQSGADPDLVSDEAASVSEVQFSEEVMSFSDNPYSGDGLSLSEQPAAFAVEEGYQAPVRAKGFGGASAIPEETATSIAAQLFQASPGAGPVTWEPVDDNNNGSAEPQGPATEKIEAVDDDAPPTAETITKTIESITEQLVSNHVKADCVATITAKDLKLVLSSWEVGAFVAAGNETATALQRIVAVRAVLLQQIERKKRTKNSRGLREAVKLAEAEIGGIQNRIAAAKWGKDIDGAVNMSATCKRLQTLIAEAGKRT